MSSIVYLAQMHEHLAKRKEHEKKKKEYEKFLEKLGKIGNRSDNVVDSLVSSQSSFSGGGYVNDNNEIPGGNKISESIASLSKVDAHIGKASSKAEEKLKYHAKKTEEYTKLYEQAKAEYEAALREEFKGNDSTDITPGTAYGMTKQIMQAEANAKFEDNYFRTY